MKWIKMNGDGWIYAPSGKHGFDASHCHKPTPVIIDDETVRVFFGVRDNNSKTRTTFIDLDINDLTHVKYIHDKPVLDLGTIGAFDDSGANVSSIVKVGNFLYMYFIGWNPSTTVHTRNSIGLAVSMDNGLTFNRMYTGAVLDRTKDEPFYTGAVDVIKQGDIWKMWYTSGSAWEIINGKPEIHYHIKYATSLDGIDWRRDNISCIPPQNSIEATARPSVIYDIASPIPYKMWYSRRDIVDFRSDKKHQYRAGYAESLNGINWIRKDDEVGIDISETGWDSEAIAYPYVIKLKNNFYMFYNGNSFGKTGFGIAELQGEM